MSAPAAKTVTRTPFKKWCDENVGLLFLIPWIIGFVVFKLYPFATSLFYSFTDMNFFDGITKYGLMNYIYIFTNKKTLTSFIITFRYALITVPLKLIFALFIAYILNFKIKCVNLFRTIYYIPSILGGSVAILCKIINCRTAKNVSQVKILWKKQRPTILRAGRSL